MTTQIRINLDKYPRLHFIVDTSLKFTIVYTKNVHLVSISIHAYVGREDFIVFLEIIILTKDENNKTKHSDTAYPKEDVADPMYIDLYHVYHFTFFLNTKVMYYDMMHEKKIVKYSVEN